MNAEMVLDKTSVGQGRILHERGLDADAPIVENIVPSRREFLHVTLAAWLLPQSTSDCPSDMTLASEATRLEVRRTSRVVCDERFAPRRPSGLLDRCQAALKGCATAVGS